MTFHTNPKPSRTARKKAQLETRATRRLKEDKAKRAVRTRDPICRFPLCGCRRLKLPLQVSHDVHKGMGGNPAGDRSITPTMVRLCDHRHQFGIVSRHAGTLRAVPLSDTGYDGPVAWEVDTETLLRHAVVPASALVETRGGWFEVARESKPGVLEPFNHIQGYILGVLAGMDI